LGQCLGRLFQGTHLEFGPFSLQQRPPLGGKLLILRLGVGDGLLMG